ncbi:MAG: hypothetical protein IPK82_16765 [Polyangiaceae bacterium]|nr:hypothetical protein [Polyangiaceae bacterium]
MKKRHLGAALFTMASVAALAGGCEPAPLGQLVVIVKTDMAPPKDFNKLRIEVFNEGNLKFQFEGPVPGDPGDEARIVLPSTLGLVAPEDPTNSIRIAIGVRSGGKEGPVRVVREVVTTIPIDRTAMLNVPIQFLCKSEEIPFDNSGNLKSSDCPDGKTCIAGRCEDNVVDSATLPDYDPDSLFGGSDDPTKGQCFDVQTCFAEAELIDSVNFDLDSCSFPVPQSITAKNLNLALGVESDGICNGRGCFVVLDANSDTGWRLNDGETKIILPPGVCDNLKGTDPSGLKVLQVVQASTKDGCPQKDFTYPTCGPWSAVQPAEPPPPVPTSIAGAQDHPIAISLLTTKTGTFAYWTNNGNNSIKGASLEGGPLISIDANEGPRDLVATDKALLFTAAGDNNQGSVYAFLADPNATEKLVNLQTNLSQPDGIALSGAKLFWTEFLEQGNVHMGVLNAASSAFASTTVLATGLSYPVRIVADTKYAYWTNEGTFKDKNGSVFRMDHTAPGSQPENLTPTQLAAPRAIALDYNTDGSAKDLYFATIADGNVWRITNVSSATPGEPELFAEGLFAPNGIAVDETNVYITNRGDGTVAVKAKSAGLLESPVVVAKAQKNPGQVLMHQGSLLWVNEGPSASDTKEGSIVKYDITAAGQ